MPRWTPAELNLMRKYYSPENVAHLAEVLKRKPKAIHVQAFRMGISVKRNVSDEEIAAAITMRARGLTWPRIGDVLGRKPRTMMLAVGREKERDERA